MPVYNEEKTLRQILKKIITVALVEWEKEIVVVDDGSSDESRKILLEFADKIKIVCHDHNRGKGAALKTGFKIVTGEYILIQDADLEYDPSEYQKLLLPIEVGQTEVVFGSRILKKNNVPFSQIYFYGGILVTKVFNLFFMRSISDITTCYKVFSRKFVPELISQPSNDFVFDAIELTYVLSKSTIVEVPIAYQARPKIEGKKLNWQDGLKCVVRIAAIWIQENK